ncbi:kinase-like protein [Thelephora ganbajun]|uniref:Kinase-like protein n=1 Tax=Thelephora ganbajun TaxID=370292 RepID=A0ACB6Z9W2_THEGA|nr:kinase-like protein [Thelephora ganbajun]
MPSTTLPDPDSISWQQLLTVDPSSGQFLELAKTLLSSDKHRKFNVSRFTQKEATQLLDVIDVGILRNETLPNNLKSVAFGILRRLSGKFRRLPQSYLIEEGLSTEGKIPFCTRGFTTLWKGRLDGNLVAIKMLRLGPEDDKDKIASRFCKEVLLWPRLHHSNVLPVYGVSMSTFPLCIVSPWMENGNILDYTRQHPEVNRMSLLVDVANGLRYLHRIDQIHGNIRGANILMSNEKPPRARLTDFGLNAIMFDAFSMSRTSVNWTAPEIFAPGGFDFRPTYASDVYALGMVIYEVLTGRSPFYKRGKSELAYQVVQENMRPLRPQDSERLGITDSVWDTMVTCWDKKVSARLQIESVIACLTKAARVWVAEVPVFLLASEAGIAQVMGLKGEEAQNFVDKLYKVTWFKLWY